MNQTRQQQPETKLFQINLIANRVDHLRRKRVLARLGEMASVAMLAVALLFYFMALLNTMGILRNQGHLNKLNAKYESERLLAETLDQLRMETMAKVGVLQHLIPLAEERTTWAPKLAAMAEALPAGMGLANVVADSGDVFPSNKPQTARGRASEPKAAEMKFSVVYLPAAGLSDDPMGVLRKNLRSSDAFMHKMDLVRLESTAEESWANIPVQFFEGVVKGVPTDDET